MLSPAAGMEAAERGDRSDRPERRVLDALFGE